MGSRPPVNIARKNGVASTMYRNGIPAFAAPGTIRYIGNPVHNSEITIVSDGVINFGTTFAFLIQAIMLDNAVAGTYLDITAATVECGQQISSCKYSTNATTKMKLRAVPQLPYGVGIEMGTHDVGGTQAWAKIETTSRVPYEIVFKHEFGVYPAECQAAFISKAVGASQLKGSWELAGTDAANSVIDTDAYTSLFNPGGTNFQEAPLVSSNAGFIGSVVYQDTTQYTGVMVDSTHLKTSVQIRQSALVFSKTNGAAYQRSADTSTGTLCNYHVDVNLLPTITNPKPNIHHFPANVQNISSDDNMGYFLSERVILGRSPARIEISDTPIPQTDRNASTGKTRRFAVCLPRAWSRFFVKVKLREQVFAGESLVGKYFCAFSHATATHPEGVFLGSCIIAGEVLA